MSLKELEIVQYLGKEEGNCIFKVKKKKDGELYLLKNFNFNLLDKKQQQNAINETRILSLLKHPNIIEYKDSFFDKPSNTLNLLMDFPCDVNLYDKINYVIKKGMFLEESIIWHVITQILLGLNYLHKNRIIHRNLQSKNIFLSKFRLMKIANFNYCHLDNKSISTINNLINSSSYTAPEILNNQKYNYKCDIWSVGCITYEMATLSVPFMGNSKTLYNNIINNRRIKPIPNFYSKNLNAIINSMLIVDPSKRPSINALLNFPYIIENVQKLNPIYIEYKNTISLNNNIINKEKSTIKKNLNPHNNNNLLNNQTMVNFKNKFKFNNFPKDEIDSQLKKIIHKKENENNLIIHMKKTINNATYRTLKERNILFKSSSEDLISIHNNFPKFINFNKNNHSQNFKTISYAKNKYKLGEFSPNVILTNTLLNNIKSKNLKHNFSHRNFIYVGNKNKIIKNEIPIKIKILGNNNNRKKENNNYIEENLSFINKLNKNKNFVIKDKEYAGVDENSLYSFRKTYYKTRNIARKNLMI